MQKPEMKRKHIPGTRELFAETKHLSESITAIDEEIRKQQDKIHAVALKERANSPRAKVLTELKEAKMVIETLRNERRNYQSMIDDTVSKMDALKSANSELHGGYDSIDKINKRLEDLELKLISTSVSTKEEGEIATNMTQLKKQRTKLSEMENNIRELESLNGQCKEYKAKCAEIRKDLGKKIGEADALKAELDKLSEGAKVKSPEIAKLEDKISMLKAQKAEMIKVRNSKREEIHQLEEEYAKFEAELLVQKSLEDKKEDIRKRISALKVEKESLLCEQNAYDPKMYDSLIHSINKLKASGVFSMDINMVSHLMKNKIPIPKSLELLDETVVLLQKKRAECLETFNDKEGKISAILADINSKIEMENAQLNELPPTDFGVLRKGGFSQRFKNKV